MPAPQAPPNPFFFALTVAAAVAGLAYFVGLAGFFMLMPDLLFVVLAPSLPFTDQPNGSFVTAVVAWGFIGFFVSFAMRLVLQGGGRSEVLTIGGDRNTNAQAPGDSSRVHDYTPVKTLEDSNRIDVALKRAKLEFQRFARTEAVCPICLNPLTVERAADLGQFDIRCPCGSCNEVLKGE